MIIFPPHSVKENERFCASRPLQPFHFCPPAPMQLILASTSAYRKALLERLKLPFICVAPAIDEQALAHESPPQTAQRLALAKAQAVAAGQADALVIGSDQLAHIGDQVFGKPGNNEKAAAQLRQMSGREVIFHTALALVDTRSGDIQQQSVPTHVRFRRLQEAEILRYIAAEAVTDCAGSAKSEALGISLLEYLRSDDPTALVGLPLIALAKMLRTAGVALP